MDRYGQRLSGPLPSLFPEALPHLLWMQQTLDSFGPDRQSLPDSDDAALFLAQCHPDDARHRLPAHCLGGLSTKPAGRPSPSRARREPDGLMRRKTYEEATKSLLRARRLGVGVGVGLGQQVSVDPTQMRESLLPRRLLVESALEPVEPEVDVLHDLRPALHTQSVPLVQHGVGPVVGQAASERILELTSDEEEVPPDVGSGELGVPVNASA